MGQKLMRGPAQRALEGTPAQGRGAGDLGRRGGCTPLGPVGPPRLTGLQRAPRGAGARPRPPFPPPGRPQRWARDGPLGPAVPEPAAGAGGGSGVGTAH